MKNIIIKYLIIIFFKNFKLAIMSKRSANNSSEEPAFKKQVTNEAFEEMKIKNIELKKQIDKLRQYQIEGQKMCQEQIEKFQERTAVAEDKLHEIKKIFSEIKKNFEKRYIYTNIESELQKYFVPLAASLIRNKIIKYDKELLENKAQLNKLINSDS